jgi:MoxR-like ATPase
LRQRTHSRAVESIESTITATEVLVMQREVEQVRVDDSLLDYALDIIDQTRQTERLTLGVSPRGSLMLQRAAQARAYIDGREFCIPDDFKQLVIPVFAHRVGVNARYATSQRKSAQAETVLQEIVDSVRVPL